MSTRVDDGLERRLRALAETGTPDWTDVRRRLPSARRASRRRLLVVAVAGAALLLAAAAAAGVGSRVLDLLSLSQSEETVPTHAPVAYIAGDRLHIPGREPIQLAAELRAPLLGSYVPLAFRSPDGHSVVYHAAQGLKQPLLRIVDTRSGEDRLLARDAQSFAWADRLAYVLRGRVVVGDRPFGATTVWTPHAASYRVATWAGGALLMEVSPCYVTPCAGKPEAGVHALDGPGRMRRLSIANVSAVSPDGRYAIGTYLPSPGQDSPSALVHVDDVRTGRTLASIDLARAGGKALGGGLQTADWRDGRIVGVSTVVGKSSLVVLSFDGRRLRLERVLRLDKPFFFSTPSFVGAGTRRVVVSLKGPLPSAGYLFSTLVCDLARRHCVQGRALTHRRWSAIVE